MPDFTARGARLRYEVFGEGSIPVFFLNGIAMSISHWRPVIEALGSGWKCVCHDFRGQTLSEKPVESYSLEGHADDMLELMDHLGMERAHIVGTSYGAEVAMEFAIKYPSRCATLFLVDGVSELDPLLEAAADSWKAAALCDARVFYKTILPWNYSPGYIAANRATLTAREDAVASLPREWFEAFARLCDAFLAIDITRRLNRITCPALVLVGELDILKGERFARMIAERISGARLSILPGAGHAAAIERPVEIARKVEEFLTRGRS